MSDSSNSDENTKVYKLVRKKKFPIWKQKMMSTASSKGFDKYLLNDVTVKTQDELDAKETQYINEPDETTRRVLKGELVKERERKRSLAAAELIIVNVREGDLKKLKNCKLNPKHMFDVLTKKYGTEEDEDLDELLDDFKN